MNQTKHRVVVVGAGFGGLECTRALSGAPVNVTLVDIRAWDTFGEISVLVSSQVLDEGLDVPDADIAVIVGGTASARRHVQRIGRVLRPRDGKRAIVYELAIGESTEAGYVRRRRAGLGESRRAQLGGAP